jgi:adenylate cyclase
VSPASVERKLAAIMFTDIVGYTALMAESEEKGLGVRSRHREVVRPLVQQYHGESIEARGDESLSVFSTALDAVNCALAIEEQVKNDSELKLHVGIHLGDLVVQGDEVSGDGVNIASRICSLSEGGGLCVSGEVYRSIRNQPGIESTALGEQDLKNVPEPVAVYAVSGRAAPPRTVSAAVPKARPRALLVAGVVGVLAVAGLLIWRLPMTTPSIAPSDEQFTVPGFGGRPAIAVLAFDNLSGDPDQEYFADGIAEDLITRLSGWRWFPVIARNSSFTYKGQAVDVQQVGRELGARYVIEGSVRKAGDRVRISAQLIDAASGHHIWAETYDRNLQDIFEVQDSITEAVSVSLRRALGEFEIQRVARTEPRNPNAYETTLRGSWHINRFTKDDNAKAQSLFRRAADLDPSFALPLCGLAYSHYWDIFYQWTDSPARSAAELDRNARACVALNPEREEGQIALGLAYSLTGSTGQDDQHL